MATVFQTIKQSIFHYPSGYPNKWAVLHHIFCVNGNGYDWKNGEATNLYRYDDITAVEAIKMQMVKLAEDFQNSVERDEEFKILMAKFEKEAEEKEALGIVEEEEEISDELAVAFKALQDEYVPPRHSDGTLKTSLENAFDRDIARAEKAIENIMNIHSLIDVEPPTKVKLYPLCQYALILCVPNDITDDWLEAAKEFYQHLMSISDTLKESDLKQLKEVKFPR